MVIAFSCINHCRFLVQSWSNYLLYGQQTVLTKRTSYVTRSLRLHTLRIHAIYEANTPKLSNFWIFGAITLSIYQMVVYYAISNFWMFWSIITGQNVQKLQIVLFFASYIARIFKLSTAKKKLG